ncbi:MAG: alpha-glucosidase/alpha-galactosidase [Silicimonas sp.]|nr:alpha-glucosidase/alpha-galactosidase [Silicimonas sp.]
MTQRLSPPKIAFIGAGSTVFMKAIVGDVLISRELAGAHVALMDIDAARLAESEAVVRKMMATQENCSVTLSTYDALAPALDGADFVILAFQIGGYKPCTVTDFEIPQKFGLEQTIADTLGIGGIMRGLRTVPHLWEVCEEMRRGCPDALLMNYVNPMAINTWAVTAKYPDIKYVGLCHSVQGTAAELARDLDIPVEELSYRTGGINHMAFFLELDRVAKDGSKTSIYPDLAAGYAAGRIPKPSSWNPRCPNLVRYEVMKHLGYFVTESSEHFAEYVPWFIKPHRPDLLERFQIPLNEYPVRCEEQIAQWKEDYAALEAAATLEVTRSHEFAASMMEAVWGGAPVVIYGNLANAGLIPQLPEGAAVEVPCTMDVNGMHPEPVTDIPAHLIALMRTNVSVQELTVQALMTEDREAIFHAAFMDPRAAATLPLHEIREMTEVLIAAHGDWLPGWCHP